MKAITVPSNSSESKVIAKDGPSETTNISKPSPPAVITVDTKKSSSNSLDKESGKDIAAEEQSFRQERTPKHANKTMAARDAAESQREEAEGATQYPMQEKNKGISESQLSRPGYAYYRQGSSQYPNVTHYEASSRRGPPTVGGTNGAFSPPSQYKDRPPSHPGYYSGSGPPPTVSPGGNGTGGGYRYYNREGPEYRNGSGGAGYAPHRPYDGRGPPPQQQSYRDHQQGGVRYSDGSYPQQNYAGPSPHGGQYTRQHYPQNQGPSPHSYNRGPPPPAYQDQRHAHGGHPPPPLGHRAPYGGHHLSTQEMNENRYHAPGHNTAGGFTRAVSSSFDRSLTKSRSMSGEGEQRAPRQDENIRGPSDYAYGHNGQDGNGSIAPSDDSSWRQLNQVASIDEDAIRERLEQKKGASPEESSPQQAASISSSLSNSPVDQQNSQENSNGNGSKKKPPLPTPSKLGPLDSLSSVASEQEPMDTQGSKDGKARANPPSPEESSTASLDLMKCHSGSSGLLHGSWSEHHREGSVESLNLEYRIDNKRSQEQRGDVDHKVSDSDEIRKAPSSDEQRPGQRPSKRQRPDEKPSCRDTKKQDEKKSSPMSVQSSPPGSPKDGKQGHKASKGSFGRHASPGPPNSAYFDQPPAYTYSLDSAPSFEKNFRKGGYPPLPPPPGSASSSTITPRDHEGRDGVGPSLASWDLQNQDSFGGGSTGNGLMSSFSFTQDYTSLSQSNSFNAPTDNSSHQQILPPPPSNTAFSASSGQGRQTLPPPPSVAESRNQSFEGGHYHGSFSRSNDSQDMPYSGQGQGRQGAPSSYNENFKNSQYNGPYPPQSSSWGTSASAGSNTLSSQFPAPPPSHINESGSQYNQQQQQQRSAPPPGQGSPHAHHASHRYQSGPMMRNYSEDSNMRVSPPMIPHMMHNAPPTSQGNNMSSQQSAFQPPPEFSAPQNSSLGRRPPPQVYIMSSPPGGQSGASQDSNSGSKPCGSTGGVYSWTKEDDFQLTEVMKKYKNPRDWEPIAKEHARGKSSKECHERWIRYLKPGVRKGQWQDHEDAIVVEAVTTSTEQPFTRWSDLAQRLPGRVGKQIRDRWVNHLNPNINHLPFSREDDLLLWNGHIKLGKRWVEISTTFFNSSRSENHIKNRWYSASFKKFISNEFGPDAYSGGKGKGKGKGKKDDKSKLKKIQEDDEAEMIKEI